MAKNAAPISLLTFLLLGLEGSVDCVSGQVGQALGGTISGQNSLGVEEGSEHFGIRLTEAEAKKVRDIPFSERTLREWGESYVLVLGVSRDKDGSPLTIERLQETFPLGA
jgi:hypothetical protein